MRFNSTNKENGGGGIAVLAGLIVLLATGFYMHNGSWDAVFSLWVPLAIIFVMVLSISVMHRPNIA